MKAVNGGEVLQEGEDGIAAACKVLEQATTLEEDRMEEDEYWDMIAFRVKEFEELGKVALEGVIDGTCELIYVDNDLDLSSPILRLQTGRTRTEPS